MQKRFQYGTKTICEGYVFLRKYSPVFIPSACSGTVTLAQLPPPFQGFLSEERGMNLQSVSQPATKVKAASSANHRMIDENLAECDEPPALSLDEQGMIQECSRSFERLFGFSQNDLLYHHFSMLFPQLTGVELVHAGQINPLLNYLCRCGHHFLTKNRKGEVFTSNLSIAHIGYDGSRLLRILVRPAGG
jgi:PAS domain S-box-containing protein